MSNELEMLTRNEAGDGWVDAVPSAVSTGYQAQNRNLEAIYNGIDRSHVYASGSSRVTIAPSGPIDENGILFSVTGPVTLKTILHTHSYIRLIPGRAWNYRGLEIIGNPPIWNVSKNGYYRDGHRVLNWVIYMPRLGVIEVYRLRPEGMTVLGRAPILDKSITLDKIMDRTVTTAKIGNGAITQAKLKTSLGNVNFTFTNYTTRGIAMTLPGGLHGFYPQVRSSASSNDAGVTIGSSRNLAGELSKSYRTQVVFTDSRSRDRRDKKDTSFTVSAQQRYVTSSGEIYWFFALREKSTGTTISAWQAPDHPCFGNGGDPESVSHPFSDYSEEIHEIIVVNPKLDAAREIAEKAMRDRTDFLQVVSEDYDLATIRTPEAPEEDGTPGYYPTPVTVGLNQLASWPWIDNEEAKPIKKKLVRPSMIKIMKFSRKTAVS